MESPRERKLDRRRNPVRFVSSRLGMESVSRETKREQERREETELIAAAAASIDEGSQA